MRRASAASVLAFIFIGCGSQPTAPTQPSSSGPISSLATNYLNEIIAIMQANSINRLTINWADFQNKVFASVPHAQSIADTYPGIRLALGLLGDMHSSYTATTGMVIQNPNPAYCNAAAPSTPSLPSDIGYLKVTSCCAGVDPVQFVDALQQQIRASDSPSLAGWIVDLRGNTGGNMWPMLAGVGPVLGEGLAGYFVYPGGASTDFEYVAGKAELGGSVLAIASNPYRLLRDTPRTAVLTDGLTASSGEAITIALKDRANTRSFGAPTCGLSTANASHTLSDGASLILTDAVMADRTRMTYGGPVWPDETIQDVFAVQRASDWLHGM